MHKEYKALNLNDEEIADVKAMRDHFWKEDTATRQIQLQKWRRLKFFWNNITNVWYDSVAHDWRTFNPDSLVQDPNDQQYYDQRINVFRAYLESIFAALSVLVPPVKAFPDDATNSLDIETAKAADKIGGLIFKHNNAEMLWLHNLYIWGTEGLVCGFNYPKYDKSFGTYKVDEYKTRIEIHQVTSCPLCQAVLDDEIIDPKMMAAQTQAVNPEMQGLEGLQEGASDPSLLSTSGIPGGEMEICPSCNSLMVPNIQIQNELTSDLINSVDEPKARVCMESYGGLNVKVPLYARKKEEVLYCIYNYETHFANAIELFPDLHENLTRQFSGNHAGSFDSYEQWARLSTEYKGEYPINCVTIQQGWYRPAAYNILNKERKDHWKKKRPDGFSSVFVNDLYAASYQQKMDDHWTFEYNPLADYLSTDPIGMLITSVQEITNDLIALEKQTLEHSVGLTIADPQVLDLNAFGQTEVVPGAMIPSKPISGNKKLQDGFMELKTATFSGDSLAFNEQIQSLGQLASGAMPQLFGQMTSETASQDTMGKNQAQSRLGLQWKMKCNWWKDFFGQAITMFIKVMEADMKDVQKRDDGSFLNVVITKAELSGKIGKFELGANEHLPMSWSQRKDIIMQLLLSPNPTIVSWLMLPENQPILRDAIGIDSFTIPGADDVDKQWAEIHQLLETEPIQTGDMMMMPMVASVEPDMLFDTHPIHFEICRKWAISEVGQYFKYNLPLKYQNVLLHAKMHLDIMNAAPVQMGNDTGTNTGQPDENGANQEDATQSNMNAPITEEADVNQAIH